jgi:polyhydroxyalkanoate synthesis regulator phasin
MRSEPATSEQAQRILDDLVRQARALQHLGGEQSLLAANQRAIVYWQSQLSRARRAEKAPSVAA